MSHVDITVSRDDPITVRFRPERGGVGFIDLGAATFLLDADRLASLRDAITAALDNPEQVPS